MPVSIQPSRHEAVVRRFRSPPAKPSKLHPRISLTQCAHFRQKPALAVFFSSKNTVPILINNRSLAPTPQNPCTCPTFRHSPLLVAESLGAFEIC